MTMTEKTKELKIHSSNQKGIEVSTMSDLWRMAQAMVSAKIAPKGMGTESAFGIMAFGIELGMSPIQSLKNCCFINGRPDLDSEGAAALILKSGLLVDQEELFEGEGDELTAIVRLKRKGMERAAERRFSWAEAKAAKLIGKDNWRLYPRRMLRNRAYKFAARDLFADVLKGVGREDFEYEGEPMDTKVLDVKTVAEEKKTPFPTETTGMPEAMFQDKKEFSFEEVNDAVEKTDEAEECEALWGVWKALLKKLSGPQLDAIKARTGVHRITQKCTVDEMNLAVDAGEKALEGK